MPENRALHPGRMVKRERYKEYRLENVGPREAPAPAGPGTSVERYVDPNDWDDERWDDWAASEPVRAREKWLKEHNGPF